MKAKYAVLLIVFLIRCVLFGQVAYSQIPSATNHGEIPDLEFTTPAYQAEALRLLIREANLVAAELQLPENLPITQSKLVAKTVYPYRMAQFTKRIGDIGTTNYLYEVHKDQKFSCLVRVAVDERPYLWSKDYGLPISREDDNAAYQLATQWLAAASIDVGALNRDCDLGKGIAPGSFKTVGTNGLFVPRYWINWAKHGTPQQSVAFVDLFLPKKILLEMRVENPKYVLRRPLEFTNLDALISDPGNR